MRTHFLMSYPLLLLATPLSFKRGFSSLHIISMSLVDIMRYVFGPVFGYLASKLFKILRYREPVQVNVNLNMMVHHVYLYRHDPALMI